MKKPANFYGMIALIGLNFLLQNVNPLTFSSCNFYEFDSSCASPVAAIFNKLIRLGIHSWIIWLCVKPEFQTPSNLSAILKFSFVGTVVLLNLIYFMTYFDKVSLFHIPFHKILNGLLYSPMIGIGLLAKRFIDLQESDKP